MAAEIAFANLISNNAGITSALGGGTGTNARVVVGQLPQTMQLPAISIVRESTEPSDTKDGVSRLDVESIAVTIRALDYAKILDLSELVRALLDGVLNSTVTVGAKTVVMEQVWFTGESYYVEEHENRMIEIYEQKYSVRVKR